MIPGGKEKEQQWLCLSPTRPERLCDSTSVLLNAGVDKTAGKWSWSILFLRFLLLLWDYNSTWTSASSILRLQTSLSSAVHHFLHFNILLASLATASNHTLLVFPVGLLHTMYLSSAQLPQKNSELKNAELYLDFSMHLSKLMRKHRD